MHLDSITNDLGSRLDPRPPSFWLHLLSALLETSNSCHLQAINVPLVSATLLLFNSNYIQLHGSVEKNNMFTVPFIAGADTIYRAVLRLASRDAPQRRSWLLRGGQ